MKKRRIRVKKRFCVSIIDDPPGIWLEHKIDFVNISSGCGTTEYRFKNKKDREKAKQLFKECFQSYETDQNGSFV